MKILSWNVNGLRAVVKKGFEEFLADEKPDILCLQETKISASARASVEFDFKNYKEYLHPAERPGYSGTAVLVKDSLKDIKLLDKLKWDNEGRVQIFELKEFYLINSYFPNANHELSRLKYKLEFNNKLLSCIKKLNKKKPVVLCGDYNVAHEEIDLARPRDNVGNAGFTEEERSWMTKFLDTGFVDTFRLINKKKIQYSWWSYRFRARERNIGWRIDYFCVSERLKNKVERAFIKDNITGSDHCPVGIVL
ncbi:MAG: exodeoxyribonuclease III [bacterium]